MKTIRVTVTDDEHAALKAAADRAGCRLGEFLRRAGVNRLPQRERQRLTMARHRKDRNED